MTLTPERERRLDSVLRAVMVVDPPADLQAHLSLLVSTEAIWSSAAPARAIGTLGAFGRPPTAARPDWAVYLGVACIFAAYLGIAGWLTTSAVVESLAALALPIALFVAWPVLPSFTAVAADFIAWAALIPVVLYLWDRDRADARLQPRSRS